MTFKSKKQQALDELNALYEQEKGITTDVLAVSSFRRKKREDRLRALGFEDLIPEQRKAFLATNIALLSWPKK